MFFNSAIDKWWLAFGQGPAAEGVNHDAAWF
jgi:hypothetical protein